MIATPVLQSFVRALNRQASAPSCASPGSAKWKSGSSARQSSAPSTEYATTMGAKKYNTTMRFVR